MEIALISLFFISPDLGYTTEDQIIMSLENRMKCDIGMCGHCNIGKELLCKDGSVFTLKVLIGPRGSIKNVGKIVYLKLNKLQLVPFRLDWIKSRIPSSISKSFWLITDLCENA